MTAADLLTALRARGWSAGTAESLTGGLVVAGLVAVPGASASVRGGVVAYDTRVKRELLGVDGGLLDAHGPVHPEVACQMAYGVRTALAVDGSPCDVGLATTGIAGPASPDGQPVGTVHIAVATPERTVTRHLRLGGDRDEIRRATVDAVIALALDAVRGNIEAVNTVSPT
ncbi:CinA family protein [Microbacterium indicum]|uniref:CinA family protein n=1 Tax=Microbacterium indicum TaxID=358100 RepID=UPI0003F60EAB|nr:CinA family protein [Microbacterium indicum]